MEANYRTEYELHGLQIASLNNKIAKNVYHLQDMQSLSLIAIDLLLKFYS